MMFFKDHANLALKGVGSNIRGRKGTFVVSEQLLCYVFALSLIVEKTKGD